MRIWIAAACDAGLRHGGWAFVRADGEAVGGAGGERRTTRARMALAGLIAGLKGVPTEAAVAVVAPRPDAEILHALRRGGEPAPELGDLHSALTPLLAGRAWTLAVGDPAGQTPCAFAAAWAEMASGKARAGGAFTAAIPKSNLAKARGL